MANARIVTLRNWYKNWYKAILIARALYIDDKMKWAQHIVLILIILAFPAGVEPTTFRLGCERSILLSYGNILFGEDYYITSPREKQAKSPLLARFALSWKNCRKIAGQTRLDMIILLCFWVSAALMSLSGTRLHGQAVKTQPSHGCNRGSNPLGVPIQ